MLIRTEFRKSGSIYLPDYGRGKGIYVPPPGTRLPELPDVGRLPYNPFKQPPFQCAIAATANKSSNTASSTQIQLTQTVTAGNLFVVGCSMYHNNNNDMSTQTISDGASNSYSIPTNATNVVSSGNNRQRTTIWWAVAVSSTTLTITIKPSNGSASHDIFAVCQEFSGQHATSPQTQNGNNATSASTTSIGTGNCTPAAAGALFVAMEGNSSAGSITATGGWTLVAENESGTNAEPGSLVYKVDSGGPTATSHTWTIPSSYAVGVIAPFEPAAGGGATVTYPMLERKLRGVMRGNYSERW